MRILSPLPFAFCALALSAVTPTAVLASDDDFPAKPIKMVVGFSAGGSTDVIARALSVQLTQQLKQQVIVDNRPGADSLIATQIVANEKPDGYTILVASGSHAINASLYPDSKVDPVSDSEPIILIGDAANFQGDNPKVEARSVEELIELARRNPGKLNYASSASTTFLATELFKSMANIDMTQVPYKGAGPAVPALIGGEVEVSITSIITMLPHVQSGRARALAVTGARRSQLAPDVPTVTERGLPGYVASTWYGVFAPAGTPSPIVGKLNEALRAALVDPSVKAKLESQGVDITPNTPDQFREFVRQDQAKWAKVVAASKSKPSR